MIAQLVLTGLAFGGQPLIGYFYGSRNRGRMKELIRFSFLFIAVVAIILSGSSSWRRTPSSASSSPTPA